MAETITSCYDSTSLVTVTDRDVSDSYSADEDVSDSDSDFSLNGVRYIHAHLACLHLLSSYGVYTSK